jgi:hypothetical protein
MVMVSLEGGHVPLLMLHTNVYTPVLVNPPMLEVALPGVNIIAVDGPPGACDQEPVPTAGTLAAIANDPGFTQAVPSGPALEVVGKGSIVTVVPADGADVQPAAVTVTVYVPAVETVID